MLLKYNSTSKIKSWVSTGNDAKTCSIKYANVENQLQFAEVLFFAILKSGEAYVHEGRNVLSQTLTISNQFTLWLNLFKRKIKKCSRTIWQLFNRVNVAQQDLNM